jgi:UDP-2,3-diacylglucosamine pyrophosphatase LpxH
LNTASSCHGKAGHDTRVFYLPGNHDADLNSYCGKTINKISFVPEIVHTSVSGGRFLVMHGDCFDCIVQNNRWLADIGSILYEGMLRFNRLSNRVLTARGKHYFSVSAWLKQQGKLTVNYIDNFEDTLIAEMENYQVYGIICGHIHHAAIRNLDRYLYSKCGDWVENCTALAENYHGTIGIIEWAEQRPEPQSGWKRKHEQNRLGDRCLAPSNERGGDDPYPDCPPPAIFRLSGQDHHPPDKTIEPRMRSANMLKPFMQAKSTPVEEDATLFVTMLADLKLQSFGACDSRFQRRHGIRTAGGSGRR